VILYRHQLRELQQKVDAHRHDLNLEFIIVIFINMTSSSEC
jgi:hypothetical protein